MTAAANGAWRITCSGASLWVPDLPDSAMRHRLFGLSVAALLSLIGAERILLRA